MRRVVILGCAGGGKTALLGALVARGFAAVPDPGPRVIAAESAAGGTGLPWEDADRFADLAFWMAVGDHAVAEGDLVFFDGSALGLAAWYARQGSAPPGVVPDYARDVFLAPPWEEIFVMDEDRRHGFDSAVAEYEDLLERLPRWGYRCHILPKSAVSERADWVLNMLETA